MLLEFPLSSIPRLASRSIFFLRSQWWSPSRLEAYADDRLRRLIRHAGRYVPYYRELFRKIHLDPENFRGRCDLLRIPPLDKEVLRRNAEDLRAENAEQYHPKLSCTSGSTGTPVHFLLSADSSINDAAATLRGYRWAGFLPGMKVFTMKVYLRDWEYCYTMGGRALDADTMKLTRPSAERIWREINRFKPKFLHGYPFALIMLAKLGQDADLVGHHPQTIISICESLPPSFRSRLSEAYGGAHIFDFYSMKENCVLITECRYGTKHIMDDYAWHEFVDEEGQPVEKGRGEILGTSYYNYAMPLIRYRTRDYARLPVSKKKCLCGRSFRSADFIEGRKEDFIQTPDGKFINLFEEPLNVARGVLASQYIQDALDHMYVNILPGPDFDLSSIEEVEKEIRIRVGAAMKLDFKVCDQLERRPGESGKAPFLISKIGNTLYNIKEF